MTNDEVQLVYREARKVCKRYLKNGIQDTDSEALNDAVQATVYFCVRYWHRGCWGTCPVDKKAGMLAAKGFLRAMRDPSASYKIVRVVQNRKKSKRGWHIQRMWGEGNEEALNNLVAEETYTNVERRLDAARVNTYKELSQKQRDLAYWVLTHDPDVLTEYPSATTKQAVSDLWCRMIRHLEA